MDRLPRSGGAQRTEDPALAAWKLPPIVAAIAFVIVGAFYFGGPGLGMAAGALAAAAIVVMAVRRPPLHPIVPAPLRDFRHHLLVVVDGALEDDRAIATIAEVASGEIEEADAEVLVLAPARCRFLDRWLSDSDPASEEAQRSLVLTLATLAKADIAAAAHVGDENLVQAVEDELRTFPATDVILVSGSPEGSLADSAMVEEFEARLQADFHHLVLDSTQVEAGQPRSLRRPAPPDRDRSDRSR